MNTPVKTDKIEVVVLCGGLGKRLKPLISDRPKPMASINGRPFLDILINYGAEFGFRRFILCIGHMGRQIKKYYQGSRRRPVEILFSEEKEALGTGGAIKKAEPLIKSSPFLVINGDSFCKVDLRKFLDFHFEKKALVSIVMTHTEENKDYGTVTRGGLGRVIGFDEKARQHNADFINTGIYLFQKEILSLMPEGKRFSLEIDFFPKIIGREFYGYITEGLFVDIGTPEGYRKARRILSRKDPWRFKE